MNMNITRTKNLTVKRMTRGLLIGKHCIKKSKSISFMSVHIVETAFSLCVHLFEKLVDLTLMRDLSVGHLDGQSLYASVRSLDRMFAYRGDAHARSGRVMGRKTTIVLIS